jgi:hypothetical protein
MSENDKGELPFFSEIKDWAVFFGWIGGLILAGGIIWSLTQPLRARSLMRSVNRVLSLREDPRRLEAPLPFPRPSGSASPQGTWFSLSNSGDRFFVFPIMREGVLVLCGSRVNGEGKVEELIPLSHQGEQALDYIPREIIQTHIRRIEAIAARGEEKKDG